MSVYSARWFIAIIDAEILTVYVFKRVRPDVYRDGGSLNATFSDSNRTEYRLLFEIKIDSIRNENYLVYSHAWLEAFTEQRYTSPVREETMWKPPLVAKKTISWNESLAILEKMVCHIDTIQTDYKWVHQAMVEVARNDGRRIK